MTGRSVSSMSNHDLVPFMQVQRTCAHSWLHTDVLLNHLNHLHSAEKVMIKTVFMYYRNVYFWLYMLSVKFPIKRNYNWKRKLYQEVILRKTSEIVVVGQEIAISASLLTSLSCKNICCYWENDDEKSTSVCKCFHLPWRNKWGGLVVLIIN